MFQEAFKEIDRLVGLAGHFVSNNHYASKEISLDAHRLEKDRNAFVGALAERTRILALATKFYVKSEDVSHETSFTMIVITRVSTPLINDFVQYSRAKIFHRFESGSY